MQFFALLWVLGSFLHVVAGLVVVHFNGVTILSALTCCTAGLQVRAFRSGWGLFAGNSGVEESRRNHAKTQLYGLCSKEEVIPMKNNF